MCFLLFQKQLSNSRHAFLTFEVSYFRAFTVLCFRSPPNRLPFPRNETRIRWRCGRTSKLTQRTCFIMPLLKRTNPVSLRSKTKHSSRSRHQTPGINTAPHIGGVGQTPQRGAGENDECRALKCCVLPGSVCELCLIGEYSPLTVRKSRSNVLCNLVSVLFKVYVLIGFLFSTVYIIVYFEVLFFFNLLCLSKEIPSMARKWLEMDLWSRLGDDS